MAPRAGNAPSNAEIERERKKYRTRLTSALTDEDDPLAAYHQFVQWTIKNYGENNPKSGLKDLLIEATSQFKDDPLYKTDLRYLKLWALYARQTDKAGALTIYASLVANDIGTSYSALYEDYANLLEGAGRRQEADAVYRKGIQKSARPLERLKTRYKEFQNRDSRAQGEASTLPLATTSSTRITTTKNPTKSKDSPILTSKTTDTSTHPSTTFKSTATSRYAVMLAPPPPDKKPEKFRCDMSLLFTAEGIEYSAQEVRARSIGLLGKKWGPPPPSEFSYSSTSSSSSSSSSSTTTVDFNYNGEKTLRPKDIRRRFLSGAEPTVTINTKEALADVFGMYNSPDKTTKLALTGSKHAPLKKVEPVTPLVPPKVTTLKENENSHNVRTPASAFRPFVDENSQPNRTPGAKFTPFVDPGPQNKTPFTPRTVLSIKDTASSTNPRSENASIPNTDAKSAELVFAKVFTPAGTTIPLAPLRDVFTDDHGKPLPKPRVLLKHERAKSQHDVVTNYEVVPRPSFTPFKDENSRTPFKVFTRPLDQENSVGIPMPKPEAGFLPLIDSKPSAFTPFRDVPPINGDDQQPSPAESSEESYFDEAEKLETYVPQQEEEQENDDYSDSYEGEDSPADQYDDPLPELSPQEPVYDEEVSYEEVPLGGRFGQFNVLTPITERTFEFTSSTKGSGTPSDIYGQIAPEEAAEVAERLAAELRQDDEEVSDRSVEEERPRHRPRIEPFCLTAENMPPQDDPGVVEIEEKAGALSLLDTLTLGSKFRPSNPCNPFDSAILSSLLSRISTDPHFYDLRQDNIAMLADLERFIKKSRKTSSGSNNTGILDTGTFPLIFQEHKFLVMEKLGEGGFGSVFKARDVGMKLAEDDDDDFEDDDDEDISMVAIKVVKPRNVWEYHVLRRLHLTIPPALRKTLVLPHALYAYKDESYLVLDLCPQGMLLNIINNAISAGVSQPGACLDELLVIFFSIELLRLVEAMHSAGFIHGDLKIDNCLLRLEEVPGGAAGWSGTYQPSGDGGWSYKGLKVIDFGRTIDTRLFPPGQQFMANWATDERDCFEVRENRPWTYQTDYFGLAGIIYCMLFGKYIQTSSLTVHEDPSGLPRHKIATPFKRYWQTDIWNRLFDALLNPCLVKPSGELPICDTLAGLRKEMEQWLQSNCNRTSNTLKGLLKKVELSCYRT